MIKNNFTKVFEKARSENRAALFIFVTGYHPNYETSKLIIKEILKYADAVEVGNPFNTSTADSSVIMNSSQFYKKLKIMENIHYPMLATY